MARDLNDKLRAGELDLDAESDPLPVAELSLEDAEDLWLTIVCQTPARAEHSRVQDVHLSPRGRIILSIIRQFIAAGWSQVAPEHLAGDVAREVNARWWAAQPRPPREPPALDLRSIPARLRHFVPDMPFETAEDALVRAWHRQKYIAVHRHAARLAEEKGVEAAELFLQDRRDRMAALTSGSRLVNFGAVAREYLADLTHKIQRPDQASRLIGTSLPVLDSYVRNYPPKTLSIVAGLNGHGKSTLIGQLLSSMAIMGTPCAYISGEDRLMIPTSRMLQWFLEDLQTAIRLQVGSPSTIAPGGYTYADLGHLDRLIKKVENMPLFMDHKPGATLSQVEATIVDAARAGARVIAFDYLSTIEQPAGIDTTDWRNRCIKRLKAVGSKCGVHMMVGAQLVRPKAEGGQRDEKKSRPNRFEIANCPAAEEAAEYIILTWRKQKGKTYKVGDQYRPVDVEDAMIIVDKAKDAGVGELDVGWCTSRHRFELRARDAQQRNLGEAGFTYDSQGAQHEEDPF